MFSTTVLEAMRSIRERHRREYAIVFLRIFLALLSLLSLALLLPPNELDVDLPTSSAMSVITLIALPTIGAVYFLQSPPRRALRCAAELAVWAVHRPPGLSHDFVALNFPIILRSYAVAMGVMEILFVKDPFVRAIRTLSGKGPSGQLRFRAMVARYRYSAPVGFLVTVVCVYAALFARMEGRSYFASVYFVVVTLATIGFGDVVPNTWQGRCLVILIWATSYVAVGWMNALMAHLLKLSTREKEVVVAMDQTKQFVALRRTSAVVIQRVFRAHRRRVIRRISGVQGDLQPLVRIGRLPQTWSWWQKEQVTSAILRARHARFENHRLRNKYGDSALELRLSKIEKKLDLLIAAMSRVHTHPNNGGDIQSP